MLEAEVRPQTSDGKHDARLHCAFKAPSPDSVASVHKADGLMVRHIWFNKWAKTFHNLLISVVDKSSPLT